MTLWFLAAALRDSCAPSKRASAAGGLRSLNMPSDWERRFLSPAAAGAISPTSIARRKTLFPPIRTLPSRRCLAIRLRTSSRWSRSIGFPITKKPWASFFAIARRRTFSTCWKLECRESGVHLFTKVGIQHVTRTDEFVVTAGEKEFRAPALVVATGGISIPKMGATGFGYELARQFGLAIRETRPGLVPLLFGAEDKRHYIDLAGVSAEVTAACDGQSFREKMLVTHRGLSGPAILQISSYWKKPESDSHRSGAGTGGHRGAFLSRGPHETLHR